MATILSFIVTEDGLHLPRRLFPYAGEVEVIERDEYILIRPKTKTVDGLRSRVIAALRSAGLLVDLGWTLPPEPSPDERAELARELSAGGPLSDSIIKERADRV